MDVITYPCRGPRTLWHLKVIVIKQRWVQVLQSRAAINEMLQADGLSAICRCFLQSYGHSTPHSPQKVIPNTTMEWCGVLMNVTSAIQGYFSGNFSFRLSSVYPTAAQCRFGILRSLPSERWPGDQKSTWCYVHKYVPVNFLRIPMKTLSIS